MVDAARVLKGKMMILEECGINRKIKSKLYGSDLGLMTSTWKKSFVECFFSWIEDFKYTSSKSFFVK